MTVSALVLDDRTVKLSALLHIGEILAEKRGGAKVKFTNQMCHVRE